jgi:hypothetical protein
MAAAVDHDPAAAVAFADSAWISQDAVIGSEIGHR